MAARNSKKTQPTTKTTKAARTTSRKPSARRGSGSGASRKPRQAKAKPKSKSPLRPEIISIICIACGLLLMFGLYFGSSTGLFGAILTGLLAGLFGVGAYLSPMLVIGASLVVMLGRSHQVSKSKLFVTLLVFWCVLAFVHMNSALGGGAAAAKGVWGYISTTYTMGDVHNGGLFGALLGDLLYHMFGSKGQYVVLTTICIVSLIFITGRSLAALFVRAYDWVAARWADAKTRREEGYDYIDYDDDDEYDDEYNDEYEGEDYADEEDIEPIQPIRPAKPQSKDNRPAQRSMPSIRSIFSTPAAPEADKKGARRVPDHVIDPEGATGETAPDSEQKLDLAIKGLKNNPVEYYHALGKKPVGELVPPDHDSVPENDVVIPLPKLSGFHDDEAMADASAEAGGCDAEDTYDAEDIDDSGIEVRGVGVEGYVPETVDLDSDADANLDDFVPTGKAKNKELILEEMSLIDRAMRSAVKPAKKYEMPPLSLLSDNPYVPPMNSKAEVLENSRKLEETLKSFGVEARVVEVSKGPTVTRYELSPGAGVKVAKIANLADDLALSLAAVGIRIEAPVPGKSVVGIEIPNREVQSVYLKEVLDDAAFWSHSSKLAFAAGKDIAGNTVIADIARMPHLLIAGATGSGKSVCINTLITSILYKAHPDEVKLLMIDPKVVELSIYNGIPHLIIPVVTDPKKAAGALNWAVREMDLRYNSFAETQTRDLKGYNQWREANGEDAIPQIVVIVDELADLMMTASKEVEEAICRLAQKARAAGIHLVIATQRPSVDVITGLIKANIPSRLAFAVSSGIDSRTILDSYGAEKLLGKGDMLFAPAGLGKPQRIQGAFISDKEVSNLVAFIKAQGEHEYDPALVERVTSNVKEEAFIDEDEDEFLQDAIEYLVEREKASVSNLQRRFRIGYNRASRLMEDLENRGIVGPEDGAKPRKVLMTTYQFMEYKERRAQRAAGIDPDADTDIHMPADDGDAPF